MERDDVVEAVARAIGDCLHECGKFTHPYDESDWTKGPSWLAAQAALSVARPLILEELREPTPEMIEAGGLDVSHIADDPLALARDIWQAMLATAIRALKDTTHDR